MRGGAVGKISPSFGVTNSFGLTSRELHRQEVNTEDLPALRNADVALRKMPTTDVSHLEWEVAAWRTCARTPAAWSIV